MTIWKNLQRRIGFSSFLSPLFDFSAAFSLFTPVFFSNHFSATVLPRLCVREGTDCFPPFLDAYERMNDQTVNYDTVVKFHPEKTSEKGYNGLFFDTKIGCQRMLKVTHVPLLDSDLFIFSYPKETKSEYKMFAFFATTFATYN